MRIIFLYYILCPIIFINSCYAKKKHKVFNITNLSGENLHIVLLNSNQEPLRCEISSFNNKESIKIGDLRKNKIMLVKFSDNKVLAYYIGVFAAVSDPDFITKFRVVNLVFSKDKKIYVKSIDENQDIKIQPNEGLGYDLPLLSGTKNKMIDANISKKLHFKLDLDFPDLDYRSYNLSDNDSKTLEACLSVFSNG